MLGGQPDASGQSMLVVSRCWVVSPMPSGYPNCPLPLDDRLDRGKMSYLFFVDTKTDGAKWNPTKLTLIYGPLVPPLCGQPKESLTQAVSMSQEEQIILDIFDDLLAS